MSGGQKHLVSMEHWTVAHRAFAVEAYFKNGVSLVKTRHRNAREPSKNTIKFMGTKFPRGSISHKETAAWKTSYGADCRNSRTQCEQLFCKVPGTPLDANPWLCNCRALLFVTFSARI
jgi:hypothetical protein